MPVKACRKWGLTCSRNGRKDTIRKLLCHPFPCLATGLPHPINGLYTPDVVQTYTMRTPSVHHAYTIRTPCVHHPYTIRTPCVHGPYTMSTPDTLQRIRLYPPGSLAVPTGSGRNPRQPFAAPQKRWQPNQAKGCRTRNGERARPACCRRHPAVGLALPLISHRLPTQLGRAKFAAGRRKPHAGDVCSSSPSA